MARRLLQLREWYSSHRLFIYTNAWAIWIAILSILASTLFFLAPNALEASSVSAIFGTPLAYLWNIAYLLGGLGILYGLLRPNITVDVIGLVFFAFAGSINCIAIIALRGSSAIVGASFVLCLVFAALMRIRVLLGKVR